MPVQAEGTLEQFPKPVLTKPREYVLDIHVHLRQLIMDDVLGPGAELNQSELSRFYGVSRVPIREVLRLLQQEGLIDMERNQRATVRRLDPGEVDQLYAARIVLESLGVRLTAGSLDATERRFAAAQLDLIRDAPAPADMQRWITDHRAFHRICSVRADTTLSSMIESLSERSERYLRFALTTRSETFAEAEAEHEEILRLILAGDRAAASVVMARHLGATARQVLRGLGSDPDRGAAWQAIDLVAGAGAAAPRM